MFAEDCISDLRVGQELGTLGEQNLLLSPLATSLAVGKFYPVSYVIDAASVGTEGDFCLIASPRSSL